MNNELVASAVASFNNAALAMPNFMWAAVLMLPVFILAWKIAPEILNNFFPTKKKRDENFAWTAEVLLALFLVLDHGNWAVIRDGVGFLPYLQAALLFLLAKDATARLYRHNPRVPLFWSRFDKYTQRWLKIAALLVAVALIASSAAQEFNFIALQIASVLFGAAAGYFSRRPAAPVNYMTIVMLGAAVAVAMQPEYFRFAQLGRLTLAHLSALGGIVALGAVVFIFRNFGPSGIIRDNYYKYIKWFMWLLTLLMFILFAITESVPVLLGFGASVLMTSWFAAKHSKQAVFQLSGNLWAMMLMLFGAITAMPAITIVGILCWRNNNIKSFWRSLANVMK
jgi:hypothetical protein